MHGGICSPPHGLLLIDRRGCGYRLLGLIILGNHRCESAIGHESPSQQSNQNHHYEGTCGHESQLHQIQFITLVAAEHIDQHLKLGNQSGVILYLTDYSHGT